MLKKVIRPLALFTLLGSITSQAYAVAPGVYLGFMAGPAKNNAKSQPVVYNGPGTTTATPTSTKNFGGRFFLGYKFIRYAAVETGFSLYSPIRYRIQPNGATPVVWFGSIDISGKASMTVYNFEVYGKLGIAFNNITKSSSFDTTSVKKSNIWTVGPTYGLGANYALTQNWVADVAVTNTNFGDVVGKITMFSLGVSYHFVDKFCGQFLC